MKDKERSDFGLERVKLDERTLKFGKQLVITGEFRATNTWFW